MSPKNRSKKSQDDFLSDEPEQRPAKKPKAKRSTKKPSSKDPDYRYDNYLEDMDEVPVASFAEQREQGRKSFRWARRLLFLQPWTNALLALFVLVLGAAYVNTSLGGNEAPAAEEVRVTEVGRTQAESELQAWLDRPNSAFAGSTIASWDGVSDRRNVAATDDDPAFTELTHNFTIRTAAGEYLRADIRVAYAGDRGAKVVSTPTITSMRASAVDNWDPTVTYAGWTDAPISDNVSSAVDSWGRAMLSNPSDLKLALRDGDADRTYTTISGVEFVSVTTSSALTPADDKGKAIDPDTMVATVTLNVRAPGSETTDNNATQIQYDVLIRGASTGAPYVTAWGGVGTGTTLKNYQNGIVLAGDSADESAPATGGASDGGGSAPGASDGGEG